MTTSPSKYAKDLRRDEAANLDRDHAIALAASSTSIQFVTSARIAFRLWKGLEM
jgi:hypothetical protein